jgi:hypothetical protein
MIHWSIQNRFFDVHWTDELGDCTAQRLIKLDGTGLDLGIPPSDGIRMATLCLLLGTE